MVGKVIAIVNMKGGVGKTTVTVCLAEALAVMAKKRVLVIDLDSQASCTYALCGRQGMKRIRSEHRHAYYLFERLHKQIGVRTEIPDVAPLLPTGDPPGRHRGSISVPQELDRLILTDASSVTEHKRLDILASAPELQKLERDILFRLGQFEARAEVPDQRIAKFFAEYLSVARRRYEYVVIDCPPGISAFTAAAIRDADAILAPGMPDYLSVLGLELFAQTVLRSTRSTLGSPKRAFALLNRVRQVPAHDEYRKEFRGLVARMNDVLAMFPMEIEQSPALEAASSGGDRPEPIRLKYGEAIPTLERLARAVLDLM